MARLGCLEEVTMPTFSVATATRVSASEHESAGCFVHWSPFSGADQLCQGEHTDTLFHMVAERRSLPLRVFHGCRLIALTTRI